MISCVALFIAFAAMTVQFIGGARLLETTIGISYTQSLLIFALTVGFILYWRFSRSGVNGYDPLVL